MTAPAVPFEQLRRARALGPSGEGRRRAPAVAEAPEPAPAPAPTPLPLCNSVAVVNGAGVFCTLTDGHDVDHAATVPMEAGGWVATLDVRWSERHIYAVRPGHVDD